MIFKQFKVKNSILIVFNCFVGLSCATHKDKKNESKAHSATFINDVFPVDNGVPIREVQKQKFYFKKCEIETRRAFPSKVEYSCEENF